MKYRDAFASLGYLLENVRQDWSAENADGVCISLWRTQLAVENGLPVLNLWALHPNGGDWEAKSGHKKRTRHIARAVREFAGRVDVVIVTGKPGVSYEDALPWEAAKRGGYWSVTEFDDATGYFSAHVTRAIDHEEDHDQHR